MYREDEHIEVLGVTWWVRAQKWYFYGHHCPAPMSSAGIVRTQQQVMPAMRRREIQCSTGLARSQSRHQGPHSLWERCALNHHFVQCPHHYCRRIDRDSVSCRSTSATYVVSLTTTFPTCPSVRRGGGNSEVKILFSSILEPQNTWNLTLALAHHPMFMSVEAVGEVKCLDVPQCFSRRTGGHFPTTQYGEQITTHSTPQATFPPRLTAPTRSNVSLFAGVVCRYVSSI